MDVTQVNINREKLFLKKELSLLRCVSEKMIILIMVNEIKWKV